MTEAEPTPPTPEPAADSPASTPSRPLWKRIGRAVLIYLVVPYLAVTAIFFALQWRLIYRPTAAESLSVANLKLNPETIRDIELTTPDGTTLRGWWMKGRKMVGLEDEAPGGGPPAPVGPRDFGDSPLALVFPGHSLNRHERFTDLRQLTSYGYDVLIVDYRGFGDSGGSPSEARLTADARQVYQYARDELGYEECRIVLFGESLGGAVALSLWAEEGDADPDEAAPEPAAVILSSTFASLPDTVAWHYPLFPFHYVLLERWESLDRVRRVTAPVTVFHGEQDAMTPISQARALAEAAPNGTFHALPDRGHNDVPPMQLFKAFTDLLPTLCAPAEPDGAPAEALSSDDARPAPSPESVAFLRQLRGEPPPELTDGAVAVGRR